MDLLATRVGSSLQAREEIEFILKAQTSLKMLELKHHKILLALFVVVNVACSSWNFAEYMHDARFISPSTVVIYDVARVEKMHPNFASTGLENEYFQPWSEKATETGLTDLQLAKFHLGCYSTVDDGGLSKPWDTLEAMTAFKAADVAEKSATLSALQLAAGGFKSRSVCNCIDTMLYSKLKVDETMTKVRAALGTDVARWESVDPTISKIEEFVYKHITDSTKRNEAQTAVPLSLTALKRGAADNTLSFPVAEAKFRDFMGSMGYTTFTAVQALSKYKADTSETGTLSLDDAKFKTFRASLLAADLDQNGAVSESEFNKWQETFYRPINVDAATAYTPANSFASVMADATINAAGDTGEMSEATWNLFVANVPHEHDALAFIYAQDTSKRPTALGIQGHTFVYSGRAAANFNFEDDSTLVSEEWTNKHIADENSDYSSDGKAYKKDLVNFCMDNSMPQIATTYEGVVQVNVLTISGLFFILAAVMRDFHRHLWLPTERGGTGIWSEVTTMDPKVSRTGYWRYLWNVITTLLICTASILYYAYQVPADNTDDETAVSFRGNSALTYTSKTAIINIVLYVASAAILLVEVVYAMALTVLHGKGSGKQFFVYDEAHTFMVFATGWLMLGLSLLVQADVKHINSLYAFFVLVFGACLVQYLSNYFSKVYDLLFRYLDEKQGIDVQTVKDLPSASYSEMALCKFRVFMQFIGWGRLLITLTVVLHSVLIVSFARESTDVTPMQSMADGRLLYYAIAFLLANCGFDLIYEVLPFMFSSEQARYVRIYFIMFYVFYVNIMGRLFLHTNMSEKWNKQW